MVLTYKTHQSILETINRKGALDGIELYQEHQESYEKLYDKNEEKAILLWLDIFSAIESGESLSPPSILLFNDPAMEKEIDPFSFSSDELIKLHQYRQNIPLDKDKVRYIFASKKFALDLINKRQQGLLRKI